MMKEKKPPAIFPFLWMHGEDEATLRDYVGRLLLNVICFPVTGGYMAKESDAVTAV